MLKNQFHDILPGSGIREIYEDSKREYEEVLREGYALEARAMGLLTEAVEAGEGELVVFNRNGFAASDYVYVEDPETVPLNLERTWDGKGILYVKDVPALGTGQYQTPEKAVRADSCRWPQIRWRQRT